jgi:hypothetical protein
MGTALDNCYRPVPVMLWRVDGEVKERHFLTVSSDFLCGGSSFKEKLSFQISTCALRLT